MPNIFYFPEKKTVEAAPTESILQVSLRTGIPHAHAGGGIARCSTCRVLILDGLEHCAPRNLIERTLAERLHFSEEIRLACQTTLNKQAGTNLLTSAETLEKVQNHVRTGKTIRLSLPGKTGEYALGEIVGLKI